jgi:hypothetical protein
MTASIATYAPCVGGLILNSDKFTLLGRPGVAIKLVNYEVSLNGGYRRINGFSKFGAESASQPSGGSDSILGVFPYALGVVVCVSTNVFYSEDGVTWTQINKDTTHSGSVIGDLSGLSTLSRAGQETAAFTLARGTIDHATNPYGILYIATGPNKVVHFHIDGTGSSRKFIYTEIGTPANGKLIESFSDHLCIVDTVSEPNLIYYSDINDYDNFTGGTSGSIRLTDAIVGIKTFRESLYVFCKNNIYRVVNINDPTSLQVQPVTNNLGCVAGETIQEFGGDLIFLAPDGLRNVAGTARIGDVELSSVSRAIQPLINTIVENQNEYIFSSAVLREKNQYRMYYTTPAGVGKGIIGTLRTSDAGTGFEWSETNGIGPLCIESFFNNNGVEVSYFGGASGHIYLHDSGSSFDGGSISARYTAPDVHLGDLGMRKTLHYMNLSVENEGAADISIQVKFDFSSNKIVQPGLFSIGLIAGPSFYGAAIYGQSLYGTLGTPLERIPLQGSGHSVAYQFDTTDTNPPFTIQGYHTEVFPAGRK